MVLAIIVIEISATCGWCLVFHVVSTIPVVINLFEEVALGFSCIWISVLILHHRVALPGSMTPQVTLPISTSMIIEPHDSAHRVGKAELTDIRSINIGGLLLGKVSIVGLVQHLVGGIC